MMDNSPWAFGWEAIGAIFGILAFVVLLIIERNKLAAAMPRNKKVAARIIVAILIMLVHISAIIVAYTQGISIAIIVAVELAGAGISFLSTLATVLYLFSSDSNDPTGPGMSDFEVVGLIFYPALVVTTAFVVTLAGAGLLFTGVLTIE